MNLASRNVHTDALRLMGSDNSEKRGARQCRVPSSVGNTSLDTVVITGGNGEIQLNKNGHLYKPLAILASKLGALDERVDASSEIYQYLHAVMKVSLSLYNIFTEGFKVDAKLGHLMRAMTDALSFVAGRSTEMELQKGNHTLLRLLQQVIECCLFINKYSRNSFKKRKAGTSECDGWKMADFISFFSKIKKVFDLRRGVLPAFVSSRVTYSIAESALRQRLNPNDTDAKSQRLCLLGTRAEVQEQIIEWALSSASPNMLWLHGVAGSGKSTVIASVAEHFRGIYRLGAFLRFTRGASDPSSVISTIAFKLARFDFTIGSLILAETDRDKDVANASLRTQFEKLLEEPLWAAAEAQQGPVIVVLDALDECGTSTTRKSLMQVFLRGVGRLPSLFKFIITSRREQDIDRSFNALQSDLITILELDYTSQVSRTDVQLYLTHEIRSIVGNEDILPDGSLEKQCTAIGEAAAGLFVVASTVVKLVLEHDSPVKKIVEMASNVGSLNGINELYSTLLRNSGISWHDDPSKTSFQRVIGLILLCKVPLTETTIDAILGPSEDKCRITLSRLRSVIYYKPGEPIRLFHASFSDFLISSSHSDDWFVDIYAQEAFIITRCFEIMKEELRFNICDLKSSFIRNGLVDGIKNRIAKIPSHLSYACRFWSHHLCQVPYGPAIFHELSAFLYNRLLYWLEVLSLLENINIAGPSLVSTTMWIGSIDVEISAFLRDAWRLISMFSLPISQSAPHIYISMLPIMAGESMVSAHYLQRTSSLVTRIGMNRQSPLLKVLEGHTNAVTFVDFSLDGSLIVSGSCDGTVRICDTERGDLTARLFDGLVGCIRTISFSPDDTHIVVGGDNGITVLDVESGGIIIGPFGDNNGSFAVSPGGRRIISVSPNVINMWDLNNGMIVGEPFVGHTDEVRCVAYSRDGCFIVLGSDDGSVRVWDVERKRLVREPFVGHREGINSVSFSPDGKYIVSGSNDAEVRIWVSEKGEVDFSPLTGHMGGVTSVAYSSDGTRIVSGSRDKSVRIWNAHNGQLVAGPFKHTHPAYCVAISPDRTRVISGYEDGTLRIWDAESEMLASDSGPQRIREIEAVRFSLDGSYIISDKGETWCIEGGAVNSEGNIKSKLWTLAITDGMKFRFKGTFEWNLHTGKLTSEKDGYWFLDYPMRIAVSPNEKRIAFGSWDGTIRVWDRGRDVLVCGPFNGQDGFINSLTFSPDGKYIVSGGNDVRILNANNGELLFYPFAGYSSITSVNSVAYSPSGRYVASGYNDKTVIIWDLETGSSEIFEGHTGSVNSVAFSSDGLRLVSSSCVSEIRIWKTGTSEVLVHTDQDQLLPSSNIDLSKWTLDKDGWICGMHNELLLWVPPDLRPTLCFPPNIAILNNKEGFSTALDFSGFAHGDHWHKCFHPSK